MVEVEVGFVVEVVVVVEVGFVVVVVVEVGVVVVVGVGVVVEVVVEVGVGVGVEVVVEVGVEVGIVMLTVNGTTWTEPAETIVLHRTFKAKYSGEEMAEPVCEFCKNVTTYIVEPYPPSRRISFLVSYMRPRIFVHQGKAYFPVLHCWRCGAKYEGTVAADGMRQLEDVTKMALTPDEQHKYFEIRAITKACKEDELLQERRKKASGRDRYSKKSVQNAEDEAHE